MSDALYYRLFDEAEGARWRMVDIPWSSIDKDAVSPALVRRVREVALSELTTFSASERFFSEFNDDVDFTNWVTIWLYEETKHPQALMRWLHHFDETFDSEAMLRGRLTHPFMKSRIGTLVLNVISEMLTSVSYMRLADSTTEPVLRMIAQRLAADEARHASGFYCYARRMIERSPDPDRVRRDALRVLYVWLLNEQQTLHPIGLFYSQVMPEDVPPPKPTDLDAFRSRVIAMIGSLVGKALRSKRDILTAVRELSASGGSPSEAPRPG